jgi:propanol-preferring alcohol dehydrogenase
MAQFVVPKRAKAIIYSNPGSTATEIIDVDVPNPQAGEVLINITHSGVCHSDLSLITNSLGQTSADTPAGQIGGHEGVGVVVKLGPGVVTHQLGDRVGVKYIASACLTCEACLYGEESRCPKRKTSGFRNEEGTFQQYLASDAQYVTPIPEGVDSAKVAPLLCAGVTVYVALQKAGLKPGQWVALSGAGGGLGSLAIQYAKTMGLHVLALDHGSKEGFCTKLGADAFIDFTKYDDAGLIEEVQRLTKGGAHAILVTNSSTKAYNQSLDLVRFGGTLVCVGLPEVNPEPIAGSLPGNMIMKGLTIKGLIPILLLHAKGKEFHHAINKLTSSVFRYPSG